VSPPAAASRAVPAASVAMAADEGVDGSLPVPARPPVNALVPAPLPARAFPPRVTARSVRLDRISPQYGVLFAVDGEPAAAATSGTTLSLSTTGHTFRFTCVNDVCDPLEKQIPAGETDENVVVTMAIKPAILVVEGRVDATYRIVEEPSLNVRVGVPLSVAMHGKSQYSVHLVELPSNKVLSTTLHAGREKQVTFTTE
jgi:hypothetical protein